MILDSRIKSRSWIFDCFNAHIAEQYIGEKCYMTNSLELFSDLSSVNKYRLDSVVKDSYFYNEETDRSFDFCLPVKWIEFQKPQWRAFTVNEFLDHYYFGDVVKFRDKRAPDNNVINFMVTGSEINGDKESIFLNGKLLPLTHLFEHYELFTGQEWVPFGIRQD